MESKLKQQCQDSVGELTDFTPSIINKRFPDSFIPENAKVTAVQIGDKVATCVEELPNLFLRDGGYPHLPTTPIKQAPKSDAWSNAGTKPDHPCLCETKNKYIGTQFQYWNGNFFGLTCDDQTSAITFMDVESEFQNPNQWREVQ